MKKVILAVLILILLLAGLIVAARFYLPTIAFRVIGRAIGGSVSASRTSVTFRNGLFVISMEGLQVKGRAEGKIGQCDIELLPSKGIYIKRIAVSDFDLKVKKQGGGLAFLPVPVELAEIRHGFVDYEGRKYTIRELSVTNFNTGKKMEFTLDGGIEGIGDIKTHGEGLFGDKRSDIQGDYFLSAVNMSLLKNYEGFADSQGRFTYRDGRLVMDGEAKTAHMSIWEKFLVKRVSGDNERCRVHATWADDVADVSLEGIDFRGAALSLRLKVRGEKLFYLALTLDYIRIPSLTEYINLAILSDEDWGPFSYVKDGEVRIDSFVFEEGRSVRARVDLKNASGGDKGIIVRNVDGTLQVNGQSVLLSNFSGSFGEGRFYGVSGQVPLKAHRDLEINGKYAMALKDLNRFNPEKEIEATAGTAEGSLRLRGRQGQGFIVATTGNIEEGRFLWRGIRFEASSDYAFDNGTVSFNHLLLKSEGTNLVLTGEAQSHLASFKVEGEADGGQMARLLLSGKSLEGPIGLDGDLEVHDDSFIARGRVNMTGLTFTIPGVMKKGAGVESVAYVSARGRFGGEIFVDDLYYTLDEMKAHLSGEARKGRISNVHLVLDAPRIERLSRLFFFDQTGLEGYLKADLWVGELNFPINRLPRIKGALTFADGSFRLPSMTNPLKNVNLSCSFSGERIVVDVSGMRVGSSVLKSSRLIVDSLDAPTFSLLVDMAEFNTRDFASTKGTPIRLPSIPEGSLASRIKGTFLLKTQQLDVGRMTGKDVLLSGTFGDRTLTLNESGFNTDIGFVSLRGNARFVGEPEVNLTGELKDLTAQEAFSLFGASTDILDGTGTIDGTLRLAGHNSEELARSAQGSVKIVSRDGLIRKWNLVSKLLAFTNIYDLIRGRVDLSRGGLVYRTLSASFEGQNGVFHTDNFLIKSPSMVIAGQGNVDAATNTIDARMIVSPLVEMDRLIDWIPLLRNIIKEKNSGLIFFVYDVKGPLSDPTIQSRYVQSVGKRMFNIIWNAIRLPASLADKLPDAVESFPKELFEK